MKFFSFSFQRKKEGSRGFTLVEVIVTASIFSVLVIAVGAIFIQVLNLQRRGLNAQQVQENALFALEFMAKEIRVSEIPSGADFDCSAGVSTPSLTINHPVNGTVTYTLNGTAVQRTAGGVSSNITSNAVRVSVLYFCIKGRPLDDQQVRVMVVMRVEHAGSDPNNTVTFDLQTTVTSRDITLELEN